MIKLSDQLKSELEKSKIREVVSSRNDTEQSTKILSKINYQ
jgi:hypothetical protein